MSLTGSRVSGWGTALPDKVVTNADLVATLDTTDEWIVERSGIRERRIGGTTGELATAAGDAALHRAGLVPPDIDLLILCTSTPDQQLPATSSAVQHALGLRCGAFDLSAACSGFVYGYVIADRLIASGMGRILLIGAEVMSRLIDWDDRSTAVLFGDGAGAVVLEPTDGPPSLLGYDLGTDGSARSILEADHGGYLQMEGKAVFRNAVRVVINSCTAAMARAGVIASDIALFVPHQANVRILETVNNKLGIPMERTALVLDRTGNTSAASVPLALADAADAGRLAPGDLVLTCGFGAGMTWASAVLRWQG